jgi:hypothetical protein
MTQRSMKAQQIDFLPVNTGVSLDLTDFSVQNQ